MSPVKVLLIGIDDVQRKRFFGSLVHCDVKSVAMDLNAIITETLARARTGVDATHYDLIITGEPKDGLSIGELGQTLRMQYPGPPLYCVLEDRRNYHRSNHLRDGYTDAFLFPFEAAPFNTAIHHEMRRLTGGKVKSYRPVRVQDLRVGIALPFSLDVFLPLNSKYLSFMTQGSIVTAEIYQKLRTQNIESLFVNTDELPLFYEYSKVTGLTERRHKIEDEFRVILSGVFRGSGAPLIEEGKKFVADCKDAVTRLIFPVEGEAIRDQILSLMGEVEDYYCHSLNVATYAVMFSKILGVGDPMSLALAGLLHDIGEVEIPSSILLKPGATRSTPEVELYQSHVNAGLNLIKELKLTVGPEVLRAISQHHEQLDGKGYPLRVQPSLLGVDGQILALADRFDYLTRIRAGSAARSPQDLLENFIKNIRPSADSTLVNPEYLKKILSTLLVDSKAVAA